MILLGVFGGAALLLASVGVYGVVAFGVTQRLREFGIRVALGASWKDVMTMVMGQGLKVAGAGLIIGAAGAFTVMRLMTTMLYDVKPTDPSVFLAVAVVLGSIALLASLIPSVRALRIRPAAALRHE